MNYYLVHFALQEVASGRVSKEWFNIALEYLKRTHDVDGWRVMLYGA